MSILTDITTPPATDAYRDGWERVFGKQPKAPTVWLCGWCQKAPDSPEQDICPHCKGEI